MEPHWNGGENDMENEKRALSWREFVESGFDGREYQFPDFEGTFAATIACKRWDRNKNLLAYLDFDDGRKIMTSAWSEKNYLGLADIPLNSRVSVSFLSTSWGRRRIVLTRIVNGGLLLTRQTINSLRDSPTAA